MANRKYLDSSGVTYLWTKIKQFVSSSIPAIKVNNKPIDAQGNVDVFATDIKMESGSNTTIPSKLTEYVKSVNGNTPNPITGDVIIETGGGGTNATTGFLEISVGIPVASWIATTSGYQYTVSNSAITTSMRVVEAWFDDDSVQTDTMIITTPSDGTLLIQTPTKPTEPWALHVALGYDGANAISEYRNEFAEALAVHATGNTNATGTIIPANMYVYLTGNSTIDDGMYVSTVDIAVNDAFTGGNLTSVANGGLNGLRSNVKTSLDTINASLTGIGANIERSNTSVLTYAANANKLWSFYSTVSGQADNPTSSGSYLFLVFSFTTGRTIFGMGLGTYEVHINKSTDGGTTWTGWKLLSTTTEYISTLAEIFGSTSTLPSETVARCRRNGRTINLYLGIGNNALSSSETSVVIGTLIEGLRPGYNVICPLYSRSSPYLPIGTAWIDQSGKITVYKEASTTGGYISMTYNAQ